VARESLTYSELFTITTIGDDYYNRRIEYDFDEYPSSLPHALEHDKNGWHLRIYHQKFIAWKGRKSFNICPPWPMVAFVLYCAGLVMIEIGTRRWFFEHARTVLIITAASLSIAHDRRRSRPP